MTTVVPTGDRAGTTSDDRDERDARRRLEAIVDRGSLRLTHEPDDSGAFTAHGRVDGAEVVLYCTDATRMGGALGARGCRRIAEAIDVAVRDQRPVIGVWHSGGAMLAEGVAALEGVGSIFAAMVRASGRVPQISVVVGPAAGGAAYGPALTDVVVLAPAGRIFVTGPEVVRSVTGQQVDMEALGGPGVHGRQSGVAHVVAGDEPDAYRWARRLVGRFARQGRFDLSAVGNAPELAELLPSAPNRAYDVRPLVRAVLDPDTGDGTPFDELQPRWAPNMVVGLGRLAGRTVGVIANNPLRKGGCLDALSAEKAARFVRMCDSFGVPLVVLVDVPGYLPGLDEETGGVVRRGAKLLHAFAGSTVPRVTLVTRKSYGGAYIAMNSRSLGATAVFAWPQAQVAVMGASAAVGILHRRRLAAATEEDRPALLDQLVREHEKTAGGVERAVEVGAIDEIITPGDTRRRLAAALAAAPWCRGVHTNIPL